MQKHSCNVFSKKDCAAVANLGISSRSLAKTVAVSVNKIESEL
jgi:hypothetical protein